MVKAVRKIADVGAVSQQIVPIEIGLSKSGDQILSSMRDINVSPNAENMIRSDEFNVTLSPEIKRLNLLYCRIGDLFSRPPSDERLWGKAGRIGALCPAEGGPRAGIKSNGDGRRHYYVLMEPINGNIFCVFSSGVSPNCQRWLTSVRVGRKLPWDLEMGIIFAQK